MAKAVQATWVSQGGEWVQLPMTPPPGPPTNFVAIYYDPTQNLMTWGEPLEPENVASYDVYYSVAGEIAKPGDGTFLTSVPATAALSYLHARAAGEHTLPHYYSVFGKTATGLKGEQATVTAVMELPPVPRTLNAVASGTSVIDLTWTPPTPLGSAEGYRLLSKTGSYPTGPEDAAATVLLDNVPMTTESYSHTGLAAQTTYYYSLYCAGYLGYGGAKKDTAATAKPPPPVPGALPLDVAGTFTGWLYCLWWAAWDNPANCTTDTQYMIDTFRVHCQANTTTPPGYGGVNVINYTSVHDGAGNYARFPPMDGSNPTAGSHAISIHAQNVTGSGAPGGDYSNTGNANPCGAMAFAEGVALEDAEPERRVMYEKWCGMPFPDDESQAWEVVERQLASTDDADEEGWWARLLLSIDVLSYRGGVSQETVDSGALMGWPETAYRAWAKISELRESIPILVANRSLDEVYLAGLEAINTWHFLGRA